MNLENKDVPTASRKELVSKDTTTTPVRRTKRIIRPVDRYTGKL